MFERHGQKLASRRVFIRRMAASIGIAGGLIFIVLMMGIAGYHWLGGLGWVDSLLNASMILGGMGPVDPLATTAGKLFASFYALFSGLVFVATMGIVLAPALHRVIHRFHIAEEDIDHAETTPHARFRK